jgi:putative ABC transport system permease protein
MSKADYRDRSYQGNYMAILLARSAAEVGAMQREWDQMVKKIPMESKDYEVLYSHADPYILSYVRTGDETHSGLLYAITAITVFVLLVTLLPTVNLMNINVTRIMERSSEIGVRKAFGASSRALVYQFIVENLILTGLGGLIGVIFSFIIIQILNHAELIDNLVLTVSPSVLLYSLLACIFFGLLSGVYPAWRMSRLNVVDALKAS